MDIEIEDALALANRNYYLRLSKKSSNVRLNRSRNQYFEFLSSQSIQSFSSSPLETNNENILLPVANDDISEIRHDLVPDNIDEHFPVISDTNRDAPVQSDWVSSPTGCQSDWVPV